jgi:hypothetical protein
MDFMARGMSAVQANELATQIDGTPVVAKLIAFGFPVPLANELVAQMTAGTGIEKNLMGLGMPPALAAKVAADITTAGA